LKKVFAFILARYRDSSYGMQKKAYSYMVLSLCVITLLIAVISIETAFGLPLLTILPLAAALFLAVVFFVIFIRGHYVLSTYLFVIVMFVVVSIALLLDAYDNPFDIYRYMMAITMTIWVTGTLAIRRRHVLAMTILGELGIVFFYYYRFYVQFDHWDDPVTMISGIVAALFYLFFGSMTYLSLSLHRDITGFAEAQKDQALTERDRSLRMLDILSLYTKPSLIDKVISGTNPAGMSPEKREQGILFCDIRDFTNLTENLEPRRIIELLNPYFTEMTAQIRLHNGEVDKLIGDGIMAIFETADDAVKAALCMREQVEESNLDRDNELRNGIGIHFGEVVCANLGSPWKMDHTVIGESVNIASRLEALTKVYKASVIISGQTYKLVSDQDKFLLLDKIMVKGSSVPYQIYGSFDSASRFDAYALRQSRSLFERALAQYFDGNFTLASETYTQIIRNVKIDLPYRNTYTNMMRSRCLRLAQTSPAGAAKNWTGVYNYNQ